ncbi:MAG: hypothetical protein ACK53Y_17890, partial [bacterium]
PWRLRQTGADDLHRGAAGHRIRCARPPWNRRQARRIARAGAACHPTVSTAASLKTRMSPFSTIVGPSRMSRSSAESCSPAWTSR